MILEIISGGDWPGIIGASEGPSRPGECSTGAPTGGLVLLPDVKFDRPIPTPGLIAPAQKSSTDDA
jgi:hypothetical protein